MGAKGSGRRKIMRKGCEEEEMGRRKEGMRGIREGGESKLLHLWKRL